MKTGLQMVQEDMTRLTDEELATVGVVLSIGVLTGEFPRAEGAVLAQMLVNEIDRREALVLGRQNAPGTTTVQ